MGSQTSLNTTVSTTDSIAVNPPSTRSVSPATSNASHQSNAKSGTPIPEGGEPLTEDKVEKLNQQEPPAPKEATTAKPAHLLLTERLKRTVYKNIPSLDDITARIAKQRAMSLSVDGSPNPPEPEMIEDPKTPGVPIKAPEHPLQFTWCARTSFLPTEKCCLRSILRTIYHDTKTKLPYSPPSALPGSSHLSASDAAHNPHAPDGQDYEAGLTVIGEFNTVEDFCRYFNWLKPPSKLEKNSNYHLFKSGIKPMWEDPANAVGGKWVLTMKNNPALLDRCWNWLAFALVGQELEDGDEICGAVVSLRTKVDRIQVWTRNKDDVEKLNSMGKKLTKLLDVSEADNIGLEFQVSKFHFFLCRKSEQRMIYIVQ